MSVQRKHPASYRDIEALAANLVGELIEGELIASPRPAPLHAVAEASLAGELTGPFQKGRGGPGGWWILVEPELHLAKDVLVPDLAGWRTDRLPAMPQAAWFTLAPDWLCEVVSPSTALTDRERKLPIYARERVPHVWLVDPIARTLEVLRLDNGRWAIVLTAGGDQQARAEPFDAIVLDLASLWAPTQES